MTAATVASPATARTRLLLEGPIIITLLRLAPANLARKDLPSLAVTVREALRRDPLSGHLFGSRGRHEDLLKSDPARRATSLPIHQPLGKNAAFSGRALAMPC